MDGNYWSAMCAKDCILIASSQRVRASDMRALNADETIRRCGRQNGRSWCVRPCGESLTFRTFRDNCLSTTFMYARAFSFARQTPSSTTRRRRNGINLFLCRSFVFALHRRCRCFFFGEWKIRQICKLTQTPVRWCIAVVSAVGIISEDFSLSAALLLLLMAPDLCQCERGSAQTCDSHSICIDLQFSRA